MEHPEQTVAKQIKITLTDRAPVMVDPEQWPVIAAAKSHDGEIEVQANRKRMLKVRQHVTDGRLIIYGSYWSAWQGDRGAEGGRLMDATKDSAAIARAIREVAAESGCDEIASECIADLPAETL